MNRYIVVAFLFTILLACKNNQKPVLSDFVNINQIQSVEMKDSISKYYLDSNQLLGFKKAFGQLTLTNKKQLDTAIYAATLKIDGKAVKVMTSKDGAYLKINSVLVAKNKDAIKAGIFKSDEMMSNYIAKNRIKIYAISGLSADSRVFDELDLAAEVIPLEWITPKENEPIEEYAKRLSKPINHSGDFAVMGVSFGGLVATEISKQLQPNYSILLSTVQTKDELRTFFKLAGKYDLTKDLPIKMFSPPKGVMEFMFGAEDTEKLDAIVEDLNPHFVKWAVNEMMNWQNETTNSPLLRIHGTNDRIIPAPKDQSIELIEGTGHFMIVDRAATVSQKINAFILKQKDKR